MARVRACAGEWLELQWRSHDNVDVFLVAAWIFNLLLRFARVESRRAAQIVTIGVAPRAVRVVVPMRCARLRALGVGGLRRHGDHRCDLPWRRSLRWGPGPEIEIGDL